jgi:hypothetical protein
MYTVQDSVPIEEEYLYQNGALFMAVQMCDLVALLQLRKKVRVDDNASKLIPSSLIWKQNDTRRSTFIRTLLFSRILDIAFWTQHKVQKNILLSFQEERLKIS